MMLERMILEVYPETASEIINSLLYTLPMIQRSSQRVFNAKLVTGHRR